MKKLRNKILSAVLVLSLLLTSSSFAFAVGDDGTTEENLVQIPRTQLSIESFSSQQYQPDNRPTDNGNYDEGPATNAIDGDLGTFWHTIWAGTDSTTHVEAKKDTEKYIVVDLGNPVYLKEIKQYPRTGTANTMSAENRISNYKVWYSTDDNFTEDKTVTGTFTNSESLNVLKVQTVTFENAVYARYIKFQCTDTGNEHRDKSIAELEFFMDASKMPEITKQPENTFSNGEVTLSVNAEPNVDGDSLSYQWYSYTAGSSPVAVGNGNGSTLSVTPTDELTYYYVTITETIDGNAVSINSDVVYVKTTSTDFQITKEIGLTATASTSHSGNDVSNVIDGDKTANSDSATSDFWETEWNSGHVDSNKWIQFDLGDSYYLNKLVYYPRKHTTMNGAITEYKIYVSQDGESWSLIAENPESRWTWQNNTNGQSKEIILSTPTLTHFVKIIPVHTKGANGDTDDTTMAAAEIELFADTTVNDIITVQPVGGIYSDIPLTVGAKADSTYQWYSNSENSYVGAEELTSANTNSYDPKNGLNKYYFVKVTNNDKSVYSNIVYVTTREAKIERADGDYFGSFLDAIAEVRNGETITVLSDVNLTSGIDLTDKNITIKSDENQNYIIKRSIRFDTFLFKINGNANVTFENITIDGGKNDNVRTTGTLINVSGGTVTLGTGTILQNNNNESTGGGGAAMYIIGGETNINGATIKENTATNGGAVYVNGGTVNLKSGSFTNNKATSNGGAVYVNNGTLNLGEANNDYALTISGNTATNGDSIYYGGTGTININAKLKLDGEIYLHTNGMTINQKCDLSGSAPITLVGNRSIEGFITVSNDSYKSSALNVFRVKEGSQAILKPTVISGSDLNVVRNSSMSISNDLGDNLTYYRGIENNLFTVTGSGSITYTWYEKAPDRNEFTEVGENLDSLSDGTHTVYCVATDGTNYMVSDVAEVTVADFVPCSKAIDKFKNI